MQGLIPGLETQNTNQYELQGPNPFLNAQIPSLRPKSHPTGLNISLKAQISAARPKSQPFSPNPSPIAQIPALRSKSGQKAQISNSNCWMEKEKISHTSSLDRSVNWETFITHKLLGKKF